MKRSLSAMLALALILNMAAASAGQSAPAVSAALPSPNVSVKPQPILRFGFDAYQQIQLGKPGAVALGDINGDGLDDLVFETRNGTPADSGNFFAIYTRLPEGGFAPYQLAPQAIAGWFYGLQLRDLDGDGTAEIVTGTSQGIAILHRNAAGTFDINRVGAQATVSKNIALDDVDGDGVPDIVTLNGTQISVYYGDGAGGILHQANFPTQSGDSLAIDDFNGDGKPDIAVRVTHGNWVPTLALYLNNATGGFVAGSTYTLGSNDWAAAMAVGDFDNNGLADIALVRGSSNTSGPSTLWLLRQLNPGTLLNYSLTSAQPIRALAALDLERNGTVDLVATHPSGDLGLWTQTSGALGAERLLPLGITGAIAFGELTDDGCTDAAAVQGNSVILLSGYGCRYR